MKILLTLLSLFLGATLLAGQSAVKILVQSNDTRQALLMAQVTVYQNGRFYLSGKTDFDGAFTFQIPPFKYVFEALASGYVIEHLIDVPVPPNEVLELQFFLTVPVHNLWQCRSANLNYLYL